MHFGSSMVTQKFRESHEKGDKVAILYNAQNHSQYLLQEGQPKSEAIGSIFAIVVGVITIIIGASSVVTAVKNKKR